MSRIHSRLQDLMRLDTVKRWAIVEVSRDQSVAEHSYRVAVLAMEFCSGFGLQADMAHDVLAHALLHDGAEARTGDLDGHFKRTLVRVGGSQTDVALDAAENALCSWLGEYGEPPALPRLIVKFLDKLETYLYLRRWGSDPDTGTYLIELWGTVEERAEALDGLLGYRGGSVLNWVRFVADQIRGRFDGRDALSVDCFIRERRSPVQRPPAPAVEVEVGGREPVIEDDAAVSEGSD